MIKDDDSIASATDEFKLENDSVLHCMGKPVEESTSSAPPAPAASTSAANRTVVPPLSTPTTAPVAVAASAPRPTARQADPLARALDRLKSNNPPSVYSTAVGTLEKVLGNIVSHPMEEKYRKVKRKNAAFGKRLGNLVGGHDCMLGAGFVVEHQAGEEVYQLQASADKWNALVAAKNAVAQAAEASRAEQERARQRPVVGFGAAPPMGASNTPSAGGMGGFPPPNVNDPNFQNMMSQMMSNPEALGQALQVSKWSRLSIVNE
jgi:hypothetical protein